MRPTGPIALPRYELTEEPFGPNGRETVDLAEILRFVGKSRRLCAKWIAFGLSVGIGFLLLSPSYYTASTTILIEGPAARPTAEGGAAAPADPTYADSQVQVLLSDEVVRRVVDRVGLAKVVEFGGAEGGIGALLSRIASSIEDHGRRAGGLAASVANMIGPAGPGSAAPAADPEQTTLTRARRALTVRRVGVSNAVEIEFTARDAQLSARVANAIAGGYIESQIEIRRAALSQAKARLQDDLATIREKAFAGDPLASNSATATEESGAQALARTRETQNASEAYRTLYATLLQRRFADDAGQLEPNARVITPAEAPRERSWPKSLIVLAIALAASLTLGVGHAVLRQTTDMSLKEPRDIEPMTSAERIFSVARQSRRKWTPRKASGRYVQGAYLRVSVDVFRALNRVAVGLLAGQTRRGGLTIAVVAPADRAGASVVAGHLARSIAESGQRTLLVDANWRKPPSAQMLAHLDPESKLPLACGKETIDLGAQSLSVLTLRAAAPITDLTASLAIVAALQEARAQHDCVVVDLHSVAQSADLQACATLITEAIVVIEARRTTADMLRAVLRLLPAGKLGAIVLNKE